MAVTSLVFGWGKVALRAERADDPDALLLDPRRDPGNEWRLKISIAIKIVLGVLYVIGFWMISIYNYYKMYLTYTRFTTRTN